MNVKFYRGNYMRKIIKNGMGKDIGIAKQVQGYVVEVIQHPRFKGLWRFKLFGETWIASDYAFVDESVIK